MFGSETEMAAAVCPKGNIGTPGYEKRAGETVRAPKRHHINVVARAKATSSKVVEE
jgi:hypothetical protein